MPTTTLNYDIVIYGGTFAGVAAACKAATYIKANGGNKKIALIIPDTSGMLGGTGTAGGQNFIDIMPNLANGTCKAGIFHGGTFEYIYKNYRQLKQYYSVHDMANKMKTVINNQNNNSSNTIITLFPDLNNSLLPSGYGYDIVEISKNSSTGVITSVKIRAIKRDTDGVVRYDQANSYYPDYILNGSVFVDASEDGKLTSVSGVGPSIGRQDWPEEFLPEDDERCCDSSCRQQAATLMFKVMISNLQGWPVDKTMQSAGSGIPQSIVSFNDAHLDNNYSLKPWNAARDGEEEDTDEWWFNVLLVYNVDGRAHERDRGTSMFPIDKRPDYYTTDQAWVNARQFILNNKNAIETAILNSMPTSYETHDPITHEPISVPVTCDSVDICMENGLPVVANTLYIRETVHTTLNSFNNWHGTEYTNYAVTPAESIKAGDKNEMYNASTPGEDGNNKSTCIGLCYYSTDINAYQRSDLHNDTGGSIWGGGITKKLRPDLYTTLGITKTKPHCAVYMPYECLITSRVPNLLIPGVACSVSSISWAEVRELPNLFVLGDAAGVAAAYSVTHNNISPYFFSQTEINSVRSFLTSNNLPQPAVLVKELTYSGTF